MPQSTPQKYKPSDESLAFWKLLRPIPDSAGLIARIQSHGTQGLTPPEMQSILKEHRKKDLWPAIKAWHEAGVFLGTEDQWQTWAFSHSFERWEEMIALGMIKPLPASEALKRWMTSPDSTGVVKLLQKMHVPTQELPGLMNGLVDRMVDSHSPTPQEQGFNTWTALTEKSNHTLPASTFAHNLLKKGAFQAASAFIKSQSPSTLLDLQGLAFMALTRASPRGFFTKEEVKERTEFLTLLFEKGLPEIGLGDKTLLEIWFEKSMSHSSRHHEQMNQPDRQTWWTSEASMTSFLLSKAMKGSDLSEVVTFENPIHLWVKNLLDRHRFALISVCHPLISKDMYTLGFNASPNPLPVSNLLEHFLLQSPSLFKETLSHINPFELAHPYVQSFCYVLLNQRYLSWSNHHLSQDTQKRHQMEKYNLLKEALPLHSPYAHVIEQLRAFRERENDEYMFSMNKSSHEKNLRAFVDVEMDRIRLDRAIQPISQSGETTPSKKIRL